MLKFVKEHFFPPFAVILMGPDEPIPFECTLISEKVRMPSWEAKAVEEKRNSAVKMNVRVQMCGEIISHSSV